MSNVEEAAELEAEKDQTQLALGATQQQLCRQYEKYVKGIDVRPRIIREALVMNGRVCYIVSPSVSKYKHPPYPSFGMHFSRLSLDKQLQFARACDDSCQSSAKLITECIQSQGGGLIKRKRNRAVVFPQGELTAYVYARGAQLRRLDLDLSSEKITLHRSTDLEKLNCRINELQLHEETLVARTLYKLKLFSLSGQPQIIVPEEREIIGSAFNPFRKQELLINTYDTSTVLKLYDVTEEAKFLGAYHTDSLVRAMDYIDVGSVVLANANNTVSCLDLKAHKFTPFFQSQERVYELQWLRSAYGNTQFFATIGTSRIEVFDVRRPNKPVASIRHLNEECPPDILQFFVGNTRPQNYRDRLTQPILKLDSPLIVAHAPYRQANCTFLRFGQSNLTATTKLSLMGSLLSDECSNRSNCSSPNLLFDSGKLYAEAKPTSINPVILARNRLAFIQSDSCGGVSIQAFQTVSQKAGSAEYQNISLEAHGKIKDAGSFQRSLNEQRALRLQSEKYLDVEPSLVKIEPSATVRDEPVQRRGWTQRRKTFVSKLADFRNCYYSIEEQVDFVQTQKDDELGPTIDTFASQHVPFFVEDEDPNSQILTEPSLARLFNRPAP